MKVLIKFNHGLGDCVQFTSVLKHLRKYKPDWQITFATDNGKHTVAIDLCSKATSDTNIETKEDFSKIYSVPWWECHQGYEGLPCTKVEKCLIETFQIKPELELLKYTQKVRDQIYAKVRGYLQSIGAQPIENKYNVCILHYQGNTSTEKKNINHDNALMICNRAISLGMIPIILDWDSRSPLPDNKNIFCPDKNHSLWGNIGTGDAEIIGGLISLSKICIAIDSGPGHIAGATHTPTLIVWSKHHPIHYYTPTSNVQHLVPHNHVSFIKADPGKLFKFFHDNYRYIEYKDQAKEILQWMDNMSMISASTEEHGNLIRVGDFWIRRDNAEQDMVVVRDIYQNESYRLSLIPGIIQKAKLVVDIGAHIGTFAKLVHKLNPQTKIVCIEACPENIEVLQKNVGDFATVINAACTYEDGDMMLLNAVRPNCESTGGSVVIPKPTEQSTDQKQAGYQYWPDYRPIRKVTLEEIMQQVGVDRIDLLKLDCEGSEISILGNTPSLNKIRFIVGEYHQIDKWEKLLKDKFQNWNYGIMAKGPVMGNFHLDNWSIN